MNAITVDEIRNIEKRLRGVAKTIDRINRNRLSNRDQEALGLADDDAIKGLKLLHEMRERIQDQGQES